MGAGWVVGLALAVFAGARPMKMIPGGSFRMGCGAECPMEDAKPAHEVELDSFWMDETPVTNREFLAFVEATRYETVAERSPSAEAYPTVPEALRFPGSAVFEANDVALTDPYAWWRFVSYASWRHVEGPGSLDSARARPNQPVVHIAYPDALRFCRWEGKDLPTEAQFEYAARGGLVGKKYAWGDTLRPRGRWMANVWQGPFPRKNTAEDGFRGPSPVRAFPRNGYGLYDMAGNVWHWCKDWYRFDTYAERVRSGRMIKNPAGPSSSLDPTELDVPKRVQRGGSFLCSPDYCVRYLVGARGRGAEDSSASNLGFRCASAHAPDAREADVR